MKKKIEMEDLRRLSSLAPELIKLVGEEVPEGMFLAGISPEVVQTELGPVYGITIRLKEHDDGTNEELFVMIHKCSDLASDTLAWIRCKGKDTQGEKDNGDLQEEA